MTIRTYTIEMKCDVPDDGHEALVEITVMSARQLLASAMLMSPGFQPQVIAKTEDRFYSTEQIEILPED